MEKNKRIAIGIENYKEFIDKDFYYVDKTLLIRDLLNLGGKVTLFTRPRRFGKTLALSTIKTFFEKDTDLEGKVTDNAHYFDGMKIMEAGEEYLAHMGRYPVISLSLKSAKQPDLETAYYTLTEAIADEFKRHRYILRTDALIEQEKEKYEALMTQRAQRAEYVTALKFLSDCLRKYHGISAVILIDEYDVPLENAYFEGFYEDMISFVRSVFESALKTNDSLEFAVITGCLRIGRESIFTGLNNLEIISVLNPEYAEYFGFTGKEVRQAFSCFGLETNLREAQEWYDGYVFGKTEVYNPWSIINYMKAVTLDGNAYPKPYWSNTSSNRIVRELVERADIAVRGEIEGLIAGGTIEKTVHEEITYEDIYENQDNLWNFLFFTGYLKAVSQKFEAGNIYLTLTIPNEEIRYIYRNTIKEWFADVIRKADRQPFQKALLAGDCARAEMLLRRQLMESISYHDSSEAFYHGYLLGMLQGVADYVVRSNRETGCGRADIQIVSFDLNKPAFILELKRADDYRQMDAQCQKALRQIEDKRYEEEMRREGYRDIVRYGICFCKKSCRIMRK